MTGPTHITFGIASCVALQQFTAVPFAWYYSLAVLVGSLAPDIDSRRTSLHSPSKVLRYFIPSPLLQLVDRITAFLAGCVRLLVSHRGVLHSPFVGLCLLSAAVSLNSMLLFWFSFAYLGHLLLDYCTIAGIPFLSPFSKRNFSVLPIRTGSFAETLLLAALLWYLVYQGWRHSAEWLAALGIFEKIVTLSAGTFFVSSI